MKNTPPYRDHHHFKEFYKPWVCQKRQRVDHGPHELWFQILRTANNDWDLNIDIDDVEKNGMLKPSLGLFPAKKMVLDVQMYLLGEDEKKKNVTTENGNYDKR